MRLRDSVNTVCQPTAILASRDFLFSHFLFPFYNFFFFSHFILLFPVARSKVMNLLQVVIKTIATEKLNNLCETMKFALLPPGCPLHSITYSEICRKKYFFFLCSATRWHQQPTCFGDCNKSALLLRTRSMKTQYGHTHTHTHIHPTRCGEWHLQTGDQSSPLLGVISHCHESISEREGGATSSSLFIWLAASGLTPSGWLLTSPTSGFITMRRSWVCGCLKN